MSIELVRKYGDGASNAIFDPECLHFSTPNCKGLIGYKLVKNCAIIFGDPICEDEDKIALAKAFHEFCKAQKKAPIYVIAREEFVQETMGSLNQAYVQFGEILSLNPQDDPRKKTGRNARVLRNKIAHAQKEKVVVEEYVEFDEKIEKEIEEVANSWLDSRKGFQVYLSQVRVLEDRLGKRWFYAKQNGNIIAVIVLEEIQSKEGWNLNRLMTKKNPPGGTQELLIMSVLETLAQEKCPYFSFGQVPLHDLDKITGFGAITRFIAKLSYKITRKILKIDRRMEFWEKFYPNKEPSYLLFSKPKIGISEIFALLKALNVEFKGS